MPAPEFDQLLLELGGPGPAPEPAEQPLTPESAILLSVGTGSTKMGAILEAKSRLRTAKKPATFKALAAVWHQLERRGAIVPDGKTWRCA